MAEMTYGRLLQAVRGDAALVSRTRLQPAGGPGDKVFPPTYEGGEYAFEERIIEGRRVPCVLLDSVQSQANRMEAALLQLFRDEQIELPVVEVDFGAHGLPHVGVVTSLDAPHRLADAILRDATFEGVRFRETAWGRALDEASAANATPLLEYCPTALLFGIWDSTGPRGGLGTKFARAIASEIVAIDAVQGVRPTSRIDPLGIQRDAVDVYRSEDGGWTLDPSKARKKGQKAEKVKPSELNHGNVTPSLKDDHGKPHHGGVTFTYALQTTVLSLSALRRLRFPVQGVASQDGDDAARAALAALGLVATTAAVELDGFLRSRCHLVPESADAHRKEIVLATGERQPFSLTLDDALALFEEALRKLRAQGLPWRDETLELEPFPLLVELARKSFVSQAKAAV